ncbi:hypothetical protein M885DRAFT_549778 [Pelagophyceae sp. CCMP2097]|nr:hypothetical protein M885DRAFT_549778 [Pelagophyceae sp. CCMP2097]
MFARCASRVLRPAARPAARRGLSSGAAARARPWLLYGVGVAYGGGTAVSAYYLLTMDAAINDACAKLRAGDAFGEERQLEGLDALCAWVEWSTVTVGVDIRPRLLELRAHDALATCFRHRDDDARAMAFGAVASLTQLDAAAKVVGASRDVREALARELEALAREHASAANASAGGGDAWARLYARDISALLCAAHLTRAKAWAAGGDDDAHLRRIVRAAVAILGFVCDAIDALDDDLDDDDAADDQGHFDRRSNKPSAWISSLNDSVQRDMLAELEASTLQILHHASVLPDGSAELERIDGALELLADLALDSMDADAALHANLALWNTLRRFPGRQLDGETPAPPSAELEPRLALVVSRALDVCAPAPVLGAACWGAARRWFESQSSGEAFAREAGFSLRRAVAGAAAKSALGAAFLTAVYGNRGARYEVRRGWSAESDAGQLALASAIMLADVAILRTVLRVAPYSVAPFLLVNLLD